MTPASEEEKDFTAPLDDSGAEIRRRMDELEGGLLDDLPEDDRLGSGVPDTLRSSDADFIQMSGLTRPRTEAASGEPPIDISTAMPGDADMDPSRPVSFFQSGVADVDAAMAPTGLDQADQEDLDVLGRPSPAQMRATVPGDTPIDASPVLDAWVNAPEEEPPVVEDPARPSPESWTLPEEEVPAGLKPIPVRPESADLIEAEQLLQALQEQPRDSYFADVTPLSAPTPHEPTRMRPETRPAPVSAPAPRDNDVDDEEKAPSSEDDIDAREASVYRRPHKPHGRRSRRHSKVRRRIIRWSIRLALLCVVLGIFTGIYQWAEPRIVTPDKSFVEAQQLASVNMNREASVRYLEFARLHPTHPNRPQAQFEAAFLLQMDATGSFDETQTQLKRALELFEQFVADNPNHVKTVRAGIFMGILNYRLGEYEKAVELLRRPDLRLRDSDAALPALRTLARSYVQLGEYELAESTYLQAASLPDNYNADVDYHELGDVFQKRADTAATDEDRNLYQHKAIDYWTFAMREPGIDPISKEQIREKCDWLINKLPEAEQAELHKTLEPSEAGLIAVPAKGDKEGKSTPPASENGDPEKAKDAPEKSVDAAKAEIEPAPALPPAEPDPAAEAAYIAGLAGTIAPQTQPQPAPAAETPAPAQPAQATSVEPQPPADSQPPVTAASPEPSAPAPAPTEPAAPETAATAAEEVAPQ